MATETHVEALRRELYEELDIVGDVQECLYHVTHVYPEQTVALYFYRCDFAGEAKPMLGQQMQWIERGELRGLRFPPADAELIAMLSP